MLLASLPSNIRRYFLAQFTTYFLLCFVRSSPWYPYLYAVATALVLLTMFLITWEALGEGRKAAVFVGLIAMILGRTAYLGSGRVFSHADWIILAEGFLFAWMGIVVGFLAPFLPRPWVMVTLGMSWLGMALFDMGFLLHWHWQSWEGMNQWLPTAIVLASYAISVWINQGAKLRALAGKPSPY